MTARERKRLAREARRLAYECAEGVAPAFGADDYGYRAHPGCAVGHVLDRSGWPRGFMTSDFVALYPEASRLVNLVTQANDDAGTLRRSEAVVFPLLALADALEAEEEQPGAAAPEKATP